MAGLEAIRAIALNTFRETVRDRVLYAFFVFACLITVLGIFARVTFGRAGYSYHRGPRACGHRIHRRDYLRLAGTNLVYKELEKRTIYVIFTKPVTSWQFITGKYLGLAMCILVVTAAMGAFLSLLLWFVDPMHQIQLHLPLIAESLLLVLLELYFILALATFFSTFSNPIMSVIFTLSLWFIGHLGSSLLELSRMSTSDAAKNILQAIYWCLPDLAELTRVRALLMYGQPPSTEIITYLVCYLVAFILLLLCLASIVNERRELP
jgi:ABC-type transport system involved in multi-copper enzyme maturation, permease component